MAEDVVFKEEVDNVRHPNHYTYGGLELIHVWEATMSEEALRGLYKGNVMKYLWRYERKNGLEDLKKAQFYLERLIARLEVTADESN